MTWEEPRPGLPFATEYRLNPNPGDEEAYMFEVVVSWRGGGDRWCVSHLSRSLSKSLTWDHGSMSSLATDEDEAAWLDEHRWPLNEALVVAREVLGTLTLNGKTYASYVRWAKAQEEDA